MNDITLKIRPAGSGWLVDCDLLEPTYFRSGARAEATARALAERLTVVGRDVRVVVNDRRDQMVATQLYFAL